MRKRPNILVISVMLCWSAAAMAQLPAPTPTAEEAARKVAAAEKKALADKAAEQALAKAQDRVARRYRATHPHAPKPVAIVPGK